MAEFGRFLAEKLVSGASVEAGAGLAIVERLLLEGDERVKDAAATCALEAFEAGVAPRRHRGSEWNSLLGRASRAYLAALHDQYR
jgi:hypothetical protein